MYVSMVVEGRDRRVEGSGKECSSEEGEERRSGGGVGGENEGNSTGGLCKTAFHVVVSTQSLSKAVI